jgi:Tol biopolymer transport system component
MALELREPRNSFAIAKTPFDERSATFSPDGKLVAYVSDESGRFEVYLQTFPVSGRRVPVTREGGVAPVWARDGRELYYRNGNAVMVVEVRTAPTLSAGSPRRLFRIAANNPRFDVTHDGRFLMIEDRESPLKRAPLSVTVNWLDVLRNTK